MEGHLRNEPLTVDVESECAHCGRAIRFVLDSQLGWSFNDAGGPDMLLFEPDVDWEHFEEPNIIHAY